ncbi:hypothetical protein ACH4T9_01035 [Micromonospora sp. NPDC020750]|uniref:hypothetical protein n=1 Tax=unclassified Micromonospora TaxID=2617518 RepID=UPI0037898BE4
MSRPYLVVLGERRAIGWVLREQRMAFPARPRAEVRTLAAGDRLYLYSTRGAWSNPTRHRGRLFAYATADSSVRALEQPVEIAGRSFHSGCNLQISGVAAYPGGVELQPLVHLLGAFPKPESWSVYLRRPLVSLSEGDAALLDQELAPLLRDRSEVVSTYPW